MIRKRSLLSGAAALAFAAAFPVRAEVHVVLRDGTGDFPTLAAALAAVAPGDTVEVGPGTWTELLEREGGVTLLARDGPAATLLDASYGGRLLRLDPPPGGGGPPFEIAGFTFANGLGNEGGGLRIGGGEAVVRDCVFRENRATERGGGLFGTGGADILVERCLFRDNETPDGGTGGSFGAGLAVRFAGTVDVVDCTFEGNLSRRGGGLSVQASGLARITACSFTENVAVEQAGALRVLRTFFEVEGCTFLGNRSPAGAGGAFYGREADGVLRGNLHLENRAASGGSIALELTRARIVGETIVACESPDGSAVRLRDLSEALMSRTLLYDLRGSEAVSCEAGSTLLAECLLAWRIDPAPPGRGGDCRAEDAAILADPLFCGPDDYRVREDSPALSAPCGPIGAFGAGCAPVPVAPATWARVKAAYRP